MVFPPRFPADIPLLFRVQSFPHFPVGISGFSQLAFSSILRRRITAVFVPANSLKLPGCRVFFPVFPSFSLHCGKDVSLVERSLQHLLAQSSMTSLTQSDDVVRLPSLLRELAHLQLFWVDKAFLADEQPFYARRHTLLQFLGVEGVSLEHVIDTVTTHTSDLSEQLMTLPALLQVGTGAK